MRINVYSQEITPEVVAIDKNGFQGARIVLLSPEQLHHSPDDDDRSAITFWKAKNKERNLRIANAFKALAILFEE